VSDLGQEAGDECESTDDLLDVDFGEKGIKAEQCVDKKKQQKAKVVANNNNNLLVCSKEPKKRKKLVRKRSKNADNLLKSPIITRTSRSLNGTPLSMRRNEKTAERRQLETSLSNRSNSLTFNEIHMIHSRMLAISESEKALIKADLEADVKYRQLIHEAESILISMKSNLSCNQQQQKCDVPSITPTPSIISSPRRQNVPTNKRVEMLRNCEIDLKRELAKSSNNNNNFNNNKFADAPQTLINKRLEILRYETSVSAPSSPKTNRVAPVKTHVTNFIYQNEVDFPHRREMSSIVVKTSPKTPPPVPQRRFLTPKQNDVDTDSESDVKSTAGKCNGKENKKANPPIVQFRSVVCNSAESDDLFFPQSEPLKRKIYSCNSTIDKIQKSLDFDSGT
jgi:hypothetical protein